MMRKIIGISIIVSLIFPTTAHSVQGGEPVFNDPNVVSVGFDNHGGCGGFMLAPQILITAAHCTYGIKLPSLEHYKLEDNQLYVFKANDLFSNPIKSVKIYRPSDFSWQQTGDYWSFNSDIAVAVLEQPIKFSNSVKVASKEDIDKFLLEKTKINVIGFGFQSANRSEMSKNGSKAQFELTTQEEADKIIQEYRIKWNRKGKYSQPHHLKFPNNKVGTCDGDSGSPIFAEIGSTRFYLGAASGVLGSDNCGADPSWGNNGAIQSFFPAYNYIDLITLAENYVQENYRAILEEPAATKAAVPIMKKTIKCEKGKLVKKVSGVNPKCPKGYKKKYVS